MKREAVKPRIISSLILIVAAAVVFAAIFSKAKSSDRAAGLPVYGQIPEFTLTERSLNPLSLSDLKGKVWIADFIFTRCAGVCPLMSHKMKNLEEKLAGSPDLRFVSFSVDPERDTPEILRQYAERYQADPAKWFFLTGGKETIYRLAGQHFHLGVEEAARENRETPDQPVQHSSKFVLVDKEGKIRGYYDSESEAALERLAQDTGELLGGKRS